MRVPTATAPSLRSMKIRCRSGGMRWGSSGSVATGGNESSSSRKAKAVLRGVGGRKYDRCGGGEALDAAPGTAPPARHRRDAPRGEREAVVVGETVLGRFR